jgi:hypothetical protein
MAKPTLVERAALLMSMFLLTGLLLTMVGIYIFTAEDLAGSRGWSYWLVPVGLILLVIGVLWLLQFYLTVKKFRSILQERSKAAFLKRLDDVEYLAWKLPSSCEEELVAKKEEFGIK